MRPKVDLDPWELQLLARRDSRYTHEAEVIMRLREAVQLYGLGRVAGDAGVRPAFLCHVLAGRRRPSDKIGGLFGLQRVSAGRMRSQSLVWQRVYAMRVFLEAAE